MCVCCQNVVWQESSKNVELNYNAWTAFLQKRSNNYPPTRAVSHLGTEYERAITEVFAIHGAVWGIVTSILLTFTSVVLFKAHVIATAIIQSVILINVAIVVAIFRWAGYTLGGIEVGSPVVLRLCHICPAI